jgi:hypothetical protein
MESNLHISLVSRPWLVLLAGVLCLTATSLLADTYRWKDKDGKTHYGSAVPAEYANQPYDVLNSAGMVVDRVEDTSVPMDVREEIKIKERQPLISHEERLRHYDRLLVIQYRSKGEITQALDYELAQLGYDKRIIEQSYQSTTTAIREQIRQAADQQRAGQTIGEGQQKAIENLYARQNLDEQKRLAMSNREAKIRARFTKDLERYLFLTLKNEAGNEVQTDQG